MSIRKELGSKIRAIRESNKITQEQLAEKAKVAPRTVVNIEQGAFNPRLDTIDVVLKALDCKIEIAKSEQNEKCKVKAEDFYKQRSSSIRELWALSQKQIEYIALIMKEYAALCQPLVSGSLPSLDDATKVAVRISEEAINPPLDSNEQAIFIAGFQECIEWLNVFFNNDR